MSINKPSARFRLVEVRLPAAMNQGAEIPFPEQNDLRDAIIEGVETFTANDSTQGPSGLPAITAADALDTVLVLSDSSDDRIRNIPYQAGSRALNAGVVLGFRNLRLTWDQCRVRAVTTHASAAENVALIGVHYRYPTDPQ